MPHHFQRQDDAGQQQQDQGNSPMKPAQLRLQPRVQVAFQFASGVGLGAVLLAMADVAGVGPARLAVQTRRSPTETAPAARGELMKRSTGVSPV